MILTFIGLIFKKILTRVIVSLGLTLLGLNIVFSDESTMNLLQKILFPFRYYILLSGLALGILTFIGVDLLVQMWT